MAQLPTYTHNDVMAHDYIGLSELQTLIQNIINKFQKSARHDIGDELT